jgi:probable HAF family extracellular repeat protein
MATSPFRPVRRRSIVLSTAVLAIALFLSAREIASQSTPAQYGVTDLGTLGGATSAALAMESTVFPSIVGFGATASGPEHAFSARGGTLTDLGTLGGARSEARATAGGDVVGRAQTAGGAYHAFAYRAPGPMRDLGTLGGSESVANAINDGGVIVGASRTDGDAAIRAFIVENGVMSALATTLGGDNTAATAIRQDAAVVGYADLPGGALHHAFLFAGGVTTDLGAFGQSSQAYALNNAGVIVGSSQLATGTNQHAFRYESGFMQDLGTLGGASSEALAVNDNGLIVGWSDMSDGSRHAFIWADGAMADLNAMIPGGSGWVLQVASAINVTGQVVGWGMHDGQVRAFVLTPPIDLAMSLTIHQNLEDTNIPNPVEAGQPLLFGVTVSHSAPYLATRVTITDTITGPVEYMSWSLNGTCEQAGQQLTCRMAPIDINPRDLMIRVRTTGTGTISHAATVAGDQPDPNLSNNSATEFNTTVSLASLTLTPETVTGGQPSLGRATLTSRTPSGGALVVLTSSNPDVAQVPSPFHVLPTSGDGLWREFYVTTNPVNAPTTVQIGATYGLVTITLPLTVLPSGGQAPFGGTPRGIPGTIEAEDFDEGGEGVAYHDLSAGNSGEAYRQTDVDIEPTTDAGNGMDVGWISAGEWLEYTVSVAAAGTYVLEARVANTEAGGVFHVEMDGVDKTGAMAVPSTGDWQIWTTLTRAVTLEAGTHVLRISLDTAAPNTAVGNVNYIRFTGPASGSGPTPFGGTPRAIPGTIQAEDFDEGGQDIAYHDDTIGNYGGYYRGDHVDVELTGDAGGGYNVGWMAAGEWLNYTVNIAAAGTYTLTARVAADGPGGTFHVEFGGADKTGAMAIADTGGWQNWTDVTAVVALSPGVQSMRIVLDANGPTGVFGNVNAVALSVAPTSSQPNARRK